MSDAEPSIWAQLPHELMLVIFEYAGAFSQQTSVSLCRVCSWTRSIGESSLYEKIIIRNLADFRKLQGSRHIKRVKAVDLIDTYAIDASLAENQVPVVDFFKGAIHLQHLAVSLMDTFTLFYIYRISRLLNCPFLTISADKEHIEWLGTDPFFESRAPCLSITRLQIWGSLIPVFTESTAFDFFPNLSHVAWSFKPTEDKKNTLGEGVRGNSFVPRAPNEGQFFIFHLLVADLAEDEVSSTTTYWENAVAHLNWRKGSWVVLVDSIFCESPLDADYIWNRAQTIVDTKATSGRIR